MISIEKESYFFSIIIILFNVIGTLGNYSSKVKIASLSVEYCIWSHQLTHMSKKLVGVTETAL